MEKQVCKHCWIEVTKLPELKTVLHGDSRGEYVHLTQRNEVGNPFCGRQFLKEEDLEVVDEVTEA